MTVTLSSRMGLPNWGAGTDPFTRAQANSAMSQLETLTSVDKQGLLSARPAAGKRGTWFYATDTTDYYRDDGTAWHLAYPGPGAPSAQSPGDTLSSGTSRLWAAADHKHSLPPWASSITALDFSGASGGASNTIARGDHKHALPGTAARIDQSNSWTSDQYFAGALTIDPTEGNNFPSTPGRTGMRLWAGTVAYSLSSDNQVSVVVNFSSAGFTSSPIVTLSVRQGSAFRIDAQLNADPTATSASILVRTSENTAQTCSGVVTVIAFGN